MSAVWSDETLESRTALLVLLALADYANDEGFAWPKIETIAKKSRTSQRAVQEVLTGLKEAGKLVIDFGKGPKGTNLYRVIVEGCKCRTPQIAGELFQNGSRIVTPLPAPDPSGTVSARQKSSRKRTESVSSDSDSGKAEIIYQLYPRKVAKPRALDSIQKSIEKEGFEKIESATRRFALSWTGRAEELQYCPHPSTWFNQERYNDEDSAPTVCEKSITEMSESEYQDFIAHGQSKSCL